jgi:hypothetical protein
VDYSNATVIRSELAMANEMQRGTQTEVIENEAADSMRVPVGTIDVDMVLGHLASSAATIISSSGEPAEMERLIRAFTGQLRIKADALAILDNPHVAH